MIPRARPNIAIVLLVMVVTTYAGDVAIGQPLRGTKPLEIEGDIASQLVDGVDRFLLRQIEQSVEKRARHWTRDFSSAEAYNKSIEPNRLRLAHILGVRDPRLPFDRIELVTTNGQAGLVGRGPTYDIYAVRWPVLGFPGPTWPGDESIHGEGLMLLPRDRQPQCDIVALPDADQTAEQIAGLAEGVPMAFQFARRLAEHGCRVIVPTLVSREMKPRMGRANLTNREYVYRAAFELGRHVIGYEVQKVLACVDWFQKQAGEQDARIGVIGYGEGGMIALYAAALDTRIDGVTITGYLDDRNNIWQQPIDRNVFGLLDQFGDAELLTMVFPRTMVLETGGGPQVNLPSEGGAPAELRPAEYEAARAEVGRAFELLKPSAFQGQPSDTFGPITEAGAYDDFISRMPSYITPEFKHVDWTNQLPERVERLPDAAERQQRQVNEMDRHNQWLLRESPYVRQQFMKRLYDATKSIDEYEKVAAEYRTLFRDDVIGHFDIPLLAPDPRTRLIDRTDKWDRYEVVLDVWPDVIAYGILTLPRGMTAEEQRPVVVCQHGLEGRPQHVIGDEGYQHYKAFATQLAERGFITFAPQNLYIFGDRFRTLQRKANPLGKTLFSIITPQHQQIINFLKSLSNVDPQRIAFYGLSYGGKTAMRVPALLTDYCLSICSADFNEWVWKNASTRSPFSYVGTGEYEIFEFDLGSTFNYAEMAALIAPRPFMVERGHFDGVAPDETVAYEYAKVRHLYQALLELDGRTQIEWFVGPHSIHGQGTFDFLHRHLNWPKPKAAENTP